MTEPKKRIVVLTAPSGSGKTTIARHVMRAIPELQFSVSATTRPRRPHEKDGIDYHFVDARTFRSHIESGELLEYEEVYPGRLYGTLRAEVERKTESGPVLLDVDVHGAAKIKELYGGDACVIFVRPPSVGELERRLRGRATEDASTIQTRLDRALEELKYEDRFDRVIVNDDLKNAVAETLNIVRQFLRS
jgi:guanylate kinase